MTDKSFLQKKLTKIQQNLKAPKSQHNSFSNFNYRSCEDILEAVKPLLKGCTLILEDEIVNLGERYYVKATAYLSDGDKVINTSAYAREANDKKGMDDAQITGAASSYARKYALNDLFAIDDTKDADTMDNTKKVKAEASDPIMEVTKGMDNEQLAETDSGVPTGASYSGRATKDVKRVCELCGAIVPFHKPACPNKK